MRQLYAGQAVSIHGSGVDPDFICVHQRFFEWRVAEYDAFAEIKFRIYEFVTDPKKIDRFL
ncbi:MAG: hypothetical protein P8X80_04760 [Desulfobacterales bacterium]